ncbi:zinc finger protein OZF-like [Trichogramma pretiosum]|uniref:zinc finger protein OZF-like n=1 Tax=Trichogramma pretiosum TaxID=7493 RepID=UPI000C71B05F|nr:zinc finger protein OZF-like [Trichogramma pretiosum]
MESTDTINYAAEVKEEPNDMSYYENDGGQKKNQTFGCLQENTIHTLEQHRENHEFEPNQKIKIEFECKDVKPNVDLLVLDKVSEGIRGIQPMQEIKIEFECKDMKPKMDLLVTDEMNDWSNQCKDVKTSYNRISSSIKIENERIVKNEIDKTFDINTSCTFNGQNKKIHHPMKKSKRSNQCEMCFKKFASKQNLNFHIDSVHHHITYSCEICGQSFSRKSNLKVHIDSVHNGRKYHNCDTCGKSFVHKQGLRIHIDSIHNHINHPCHTCGKAYLKVHIDSVHNGTKHKCEICGNLFNQQATLKTHIDSVHKGISYPCDICGKSYKSKTYFKLHIDSVHNGR